MEGQSGSKAESVCDYYFHDIKKLPLLSAEEQSVLITHAQEGDQPARAKLIGSNLRLVISVARKYSGFGQPLDDLIQDGNLGLLKAVEKFKPDKGACFSSYAVWWIRQAIVRGISQQARLIRLPVNVEEQRRRLFRIENRLTQKLGRKPLLHEIAEAMELPDGQVVQLQTSIQPAVSLEGQVGCQEDGDMLKDLLEDKTVVSPVTNVQRKRQQVQIRTLVSRLSKEEQRVIEMRFGLDDTKARSLKDIGQQLGISRDKISQIENRALQKLRSYITADGTELAVSKRRKRIGLPCHIRKTRALQVQRFLSAKAGAA